MSIYDEKDENSLRNQALEQLRATRAKLEAEHPDLMKTMRRRMLEQQESVAVMAEEPAEDTQIDRKKNMVSVLKFLELCPNPGLFRDEIKIFLAESRSA